MIFVVLNFVPSVLIEKENPPSLRVHVYARLRQVVIERVKFGQYKKFSRSWSSTVRRNWRCSRIGVRCSKWNDPENVQTRGIYYLCF